MKIFWNLIIIAFLFISCQNTDLESKTTNKNKKTTNVKNAENQIVRTDKGKARISVANSPKYALAKLTVEKPTFRDETIVLNFKVENFKLRVNTPDYKRKYIQNDKKGQYIAVIINNNSFYKSYDGKLEIPNINGEYEILAFLCRSYNEGVKHSNANQYFRLKTSDKSIEIIKDENPKIYLNRPTENEQFEYEEIDRILLDTYVLPNNLHPELFKIRVTINGELFMLSKWQCHNIDRLKPGKHEIEIMLMNPNNQLYRGESTRIKRTFEILDKRKM